jgi:hypothetical protein
LISRDFNLLSLVHNSEPDIMQNDSEPILEWHWEEDESKGEAPRFVPDRVGWPAHDEVVSDHIANAALERGRLDIVARYLRERVIPMIRNRKFGPYATDTLYKLSDMLEPRPGVERHLKFARAAPGAPSSPARTLFRNLELGAEIGQRVREGCALKAAVADVCAERGIEKSKAYEAYKDLQTYRDCNARGEPMPIPVRKRR